MRPKDAANLDFWEEWLLIEGYERRAEEAEAEDYSGDGYSQGQTPRRSQASRGAATWTDESDDAPLHHYPRATDPMASAEELITLGVQYSYE